MNVNITNEGDCTIVAPQEKIDFASATELEEIIEEQSKKCNSMIIDMEKVAYISSAGLRTILYADELMSSKKGMSLRNVGMSVKEILDISGFSGVIKFE